MVEHLQQILSTPCFVALIRHGERADLAPHAPLSKPYTVKHDPPLTDTGIQQAFETGQALKKMLAAYDTIIIECSPFIRTMMTAANIVKGMGMEGRVKIQINYLLSEQLAPYFFNHCPMSSLLIRNLPKETIINDYLDGIPYEESDFYRTQADKLHPESQDEGKLRVKQMVHYYIDKSNQSTVAHIAVTHGFFVKHFSKEHGGVKETAEYCAISGIEINQDKTSLVMDSDSCHVKSWSVQIE
ncbi:hypothetical protein FGO68_gene876 [Halteria grandinella]|uniref:Histidine phosphatase family protein n=1 Tax=Halteria grandinella TaxID=5974 RepID=A0A8J8NJV1_HALGN|nr:hypothetical protein FGO68_gene876 [Halteria grandinella]